MFKIIKREELAKDIIRIEIEAAQVARKACAGQFVVIVIDEKGERIPLTLADWNTAKGTITLIFQKVGFSTRKLAELKEGESIAHLLGPLGHPTEIKKFGEVYCIGGGVGIAEVYPVSRAFKEAGNRVVGIIGARRKELIILEDKMKEACDELFITTDDGSLGKKGFVTSVLEELFVVIDRSSHTKYPDLIYSIGPLLMMKAVSEMTKDLNIMTIVSLNPIMVDATGMCGACRCSVGGKTVFGCVDGPDFNAHQVNFDELAKRLMLFESEEKKLQ